MWITFNSGSNITYMVSVSNIYSKFKYTKI
nr:MAG TPA: hypothetical protein [Caudoviricetes sp.]